MYKYKGDYKYMLQGRMKDDTKWFDIMSFCPSMKLEDYIKEHKELHPDWKIRIIPNKKWKGKNKDYSRLTWDMINGI